MKSKILVFLQFFIIFLMSLSYGEAASYKFVGISFLVFGGVVGLLALKAHKRGNFNIRPDIKQDCILVTDGIYGYIRHPMYLSVLSMMFGVFVLYFSLYELVLYLCLVITLLVKLHYEENLWTCHSSEYAKYKEKTRKIIPFVF